MILVNLLGAFFRSGMSGSRIYGLFRDPHQNEYLHYVGLPGHTPATSREWVKGKLRHALCSPEDFVWTRDTKFPANPSLVVQQDIVDSSERNYGWPKESYHRPADRIAECHLLDQVAAGIEAGSQD
jgi:hypothetical protein